MLTEIFPTSYHGAVTAGVGPGSTVYVAGAGPVGLACAHACQLLGVAVVIVGDMLDERLAQARSFGRETVDLKQHASVSEMIAAVLGEPEVGCTVDCVGFEARGVGRQAREERPRTVLNQMMQAPEPGAASASPVSTSPRTQPPLTKPQSLGTCRFASAWGGRRVSTSIPAS